MDPNGRLHMPGFVGDTFEETGVLKQREPVAQKPRSPDRSKYAPHQGKREMERRRKRLQSA